MPPSSPQFTPAQVLQAGRRAEAEGKSDLAEHFYRHVVEHYGASVEAAVAREGLSRLTATLGGDGGAAPVVPAVREVPPPVPPGGLAPVRPVSTREVAPVAPVRPVSTPLASAPTAATPPTLDVAPSPQASAGLVPAASPEPSRSIAGRPRSHPYRAGRAIVGVLSVVGWLMVIVGVALVPLAMTRQAGEMLPLLASPAGLAATLGWAAVQAFGGLIVVLVAQVARAVFDMAAHAERGDTPSGDDGRRR